MINHFPLDFPKSKLVGVKGLEELKQSGEIFEIFAIDSLSNNDWRKSIVEFLENPTGTTTRKIKYKALSYVIIGNELFKKSPEGILLKFLSESETYLEIFYVHSGAHHACHKMQWILFR